MGEQGIEETGCPGNMDISRGEEGGGGGRR